MKNYPWDMLNNLCFHVCAQKSLFILGQNVNAFFYLSISTRSPDIRVHRAGSQLKTLRESYPKNYLLSAPPTLVVLEHPNLVYLSQGSSVLAQLAHQNSSSRLEQHSRDLFPWLVLLISLFCTHTCTWTPSS